MTDSAALHTQEQVYSQISGSFTTLVYYLRVDGGWIYATTLMRAYWFGRDQISATIAFAPDGRFPSEKQTHSR